MSKLVFSFLYLIDIDKFNVSDWFVDNSMSPYIYFADYFNV